MTFLLSMAEAGAAYAYFIAKIVIAAIMVVCAGFIIFVVMKQSGNSDGTEAISGSRHDQDSYYGKNASGRKEEKLKLWTYICAGALALCAIVFLILTAVVDKLP